MNQTFTFLEELQKKLDATPIEACKDIDSPEVKAGDTVLGEMSPLARRLHEVAEHYEREQKKIRATCLRITAQALETGRENEVKDELGSLEHMYAILAMKSEAARKVMWVELNTQYHDQVTKDSQAFGICKGNIVVITKATMPFPFPFLFGGGKQP